VAANALTGIHRALVDYVRRRVLADDQVTRLAADFREQAIRGFALLEGGLGDRFAAPPGDPMRPVREVADREEKEARPDHGTEL
jgi:hypothetical protein